MHACMQCIRALPTHVCRLVVYGGYNYLEGQNDDDAIQAYRSSKTPDNYVFSVIRTIRRGDTQASPWSRAPLLGHVRIAQSQ